jgi:zinc/manganese transport system substrate-binding protein
MRGFATVLLAAFALAAPAAAKLQVVATIPDLADVARQIGGDLVDVSSIATGVEDIHGVPMKPSFATLLNKADVVVLLGLEAEHAFLPGLLDAAKNPKIVRGAPGYVDCSVYILPLEAPATLDRAEGDQHPMGNPHYNLDPVAGKDMARALAEGLERNDAEHAATYKANLESYLDRLDAAISRWEAEAAPLKGVKLVSYHPDMVYFADRYGMQPAGTIEIKPGVSPTPRHIEELETMMRQQKVQLVVRERQYPAGLAETVAQATGATLVELPVMVGGVPEAKDYIGLIDYNLHTLLKALKGG